jgi:hypothetical protein
MKIQDTTFQSLPEEIKKVVLSTDVDVQIEKIAKPHGLHIDQIAELTSETRMVLTGESAAKDFVANIMDRLEIDKELAETLAQEINTIVFTSIRASMQVVQEGMLKEQAVTQQDKAISEIEQSIENPTSYNAGPINVLESVANNDSIADHMLSGAVAAPMTTATVKVSAPISTPSPAAAPAPRATDPYREAIE